MRAFFKVVNKYGYCPEKYWPYDPTKWSKFPSPLAQKHAYDKKGKIIYRRIYETGDDRITVLKDAIAAGYGFIFGTTVGKNFENYNGAPLDPPDFTDQLGGHALLGVDVLPGDNFLILNSWGKKYGDHGYCIFTSDYMTWDSTADFYIIDEVA